MVRIRPTITCCCFSCEGDACPSKSLPAPPTVVGAVVFAQAPNVQYSSRLRKKGSGGALRRDIGTFPNSRPARRTVSEYPVIRAMHAEATQISLKNPREVPRRLQSVTK